MKNSLFILSVLFFFSSNIFSQKQIDVDGVIIPRFIKFEGRDIELNGIGIRSRLWFDVYTQALYLTKLSQDPVEILESNTPMGIRIQITSSLVTARKFSKSINIGIEKSVGEIEFPKYKERLDLLDSFVNSEVIVEKDIFNLIYNPADES